MSSDNFDFITQDFVNDFTRLFREDTGINIEFDMSTLSGVAMWHIFAAQFFLTDKLELWRITLQMYIFA